MSKDDQKNIMKMDTMIEAQNIALGRRGCGVEDVLAFCTSVQNVPVIKMIFQRQCFWITSTKLASHKDDIPETMSGAEGENYHHIIQWVK